MSFELVSDITVNRPEDVVRNVQSLLVVVDSPAGLYRPGAERVEGTMAIRDADADPSDLELVSLVPISNSRIPIIRLLRGNLPDVELDVRVFGVPNRSGTETPIAVGAAKGLRFEQGAPASVSLPFNLLPGMLPPRVTDVSVAEGDAISGCIGTMIWIVFSKAIDSETLNQRIWVESASNEFVAVTAVPFGNVVGLYIASDEDWETPWTRAYTLHVTSHLKDVGGARLDQVAERRGDQEFQQSFRVECDGNVAPLHCGFVYRGVTGSFCSGPEGRFECADEHCVPSSCASVRCPRGYACDPATAMCDVDCRIYGDSTSCPSDRPTCDDTTGACVADPS